MRRKVFSLTTKTTTAWTIENRTCGCAHMSRTTSTGDPAAEHHQDIKVFPGTREQISILRPFRIKKRDFISVRSETRSMQRRHTIKKQKNSSENSLTSTFQMIPKFYLIVGVNISISSCLKAVWKICVLKFS